MRSFSFYCSAASLVMEYSKFSVSPARIKIVQPHAAPGTLWASTKTVQISTKPVILF
ncbi:MULTISPECIES: hypothetical protein [Methanosarcina]|uniref:hypothetical protein n=1 Tax=Methanosarcina TaxID=2207 RepID=UPI000AE0E28E|nr:MULTISPECIES: hypothetical protein [Methanosarcina]